MSEKRHFQRVPFDTVALVINAGQVHSCDLIDLALQGAMFNAPDRLPLKCGDQCGLSIFLPSADLTLEFDGELVHQEGSNYGFRFTGEDEVTLAHLRRLLELNSGDAQEIDREFTDWLEN